MKITSEHGHLAEELEHSECRLVWEDMNCAEHEFDSVRLHSLTLLSYAGSGTWS